MSIRLRLTLLYSVILALTLFVFSSTLYLTQAQVTLNDIKANLQRQAGAFANAQRHFPGSPSDQPSNLTLPGRWTQLRRADGTVTAQTADLTDTPLPLSDAGLHAVQSGADWFEPAQVQDQPLFIYSRPISTQGSVSEIVQVAWPAAERDQALGALRVILIVGSGLVLIAAFVIGWLLAGTALGPIHQITQTAQAIGAERNFGARVQYKGPTDEVGQLAITFNTMLTELESAYRQLEQSLDSQRRFVADASHELRTPLTTVRGNIDLLGHEPPIPASERDEVLADTRDEVQRLIRLVNQLLLLARVDAGRELRREPVPLRPLVEDVCRQAKLLAPDKSLMCEATTDAVALGDPDALKQVLLILVDNARMHTPPQSTIGVATVVGEKQVSVLVRDTGMGIPPETLPHIFERFYRGDISRSGASSGLGLAIAQELVRAQDGTITVESKVGEGSVFTVILPRSA